MGEATGSLVVVANALESAAVRTAIAGRVHRGLTTYSTAGSTADGWVEFVHALLAAKEKAAAL
jgi:hypothetical protein